MASPHVAGAAAVYLGANASASPSQVSSGLNALSTRSVICDPGTSTTGNLLYIGALVDTPAQPSPCGGFAQPAPAPAPGGGGGGGGGGSSGDGGSSGGGGLHEITQLSSSSGSLAGGETISLAGWGFATARAVMFGDTASPSFTVRHGGHIDAVVPPSATSGPVDVHVILAPLVGRASMWGGYTYVDGPSSVPGAQTPLVPSTTNQVATRVMTKFPIPRDALQLSGSGKTVTLKIDLEQLHFANTSSAVVSVSLLKRTKVKIKGKGKTGITKKGKPRKSKILYRPIDSAQLNGQDMAAFTEVKVKPGYYRIVFELEDSSTVVSKTFPVTKKEITQTLRSSRA